MEVRRPANLEPKKPQASAQPSSASVRETSAPFLEVRGHQAYSVPASNASRAASLLVDSSLAFLALVAGLVAFRVATPVPRLHWILSSAALGVLAWAIGRALFARSPGEIVWRIKPKAESFEERFLPTGLQPSGFQARGPVLVSAAIVAFVAGSSFGMLRTHAGWTIASEWNLEQSGEALKSDRSIVTPFFYALGAWPRMFEGKPVFYALPYAKGPPDLFVGQVIARWDASAVRLVFEGPKTPPALAGGYDPREMLRQCLTSLSGGEFGPIRCLRARSAALDRHLREMDALEPRRFSIRWLTVRNPAIAAREQVQGIYLSAEGATRGQDRFVLLLPNGAHQALMLDYPLGNTGEEAKSLFAASLRSLRASPELAHGKRWVDQRIGTFKLDELQQIKDPAVLVQRIAEIQTVLISKISVDPRTYDSYFHLAGTASLLARYAIQEKREDWSAVAKPMIQSLYMYSKDIAPTDPRTAQIENLWLQVKRN